MTVVYEDNHIIVVNKTASEIVQADKTGDTPLSETVKQYLKEKYQKPGNVFIGVTHRLDRPVSGLVIFAKTSKALTRLNEMFRTTEVKKTYWAVVKNAPKETEGELVHFLVRNEKQNKSYAYDKEVPKSKKAVLDYRLIGRSENYYLLEVDLKTGRHHQLVLIAKTCRQLVVTGEEGEVIGNVRNLVLHTVVVGEQLVTGAHVRFQNLVSILVLARCCSGVSEVDL